MKLYYNPISSYSRKVLFTMYEKGIDFDREIVNLFDPEAKAEYTKNLNPMGKVPLLVVEEEDRMIPESSIIIEYLDTHFDTGPKLIPDDMNLARQARFHDRVSDLYLMDPIVSNLFQGMKPADKRDMGLLDSNTMRINTSLMLLDKGLNNKKFVLGESLSLGDISPLSALTWFTLAGNNLGDFPNVKGWYEHMSDRDSWKRILKESQPMVDGLMSKMPK